jgi:hypothetical protein
LAFSEADHRERLLLADSPHSSIVFARRLANGQRLFQHRDHWARDAALDQGTREKVT